MGKNDTRVLAGSALLVTKNAGLKKGLKKKLTKGNSSNR